jgi:hypothetical protein
MPIRYSSLLALLLTTLAAPAAFAQTPAAKLPISVAPYFGAVLDTSDDWLVFGGEVRIPVSRRPFEINPRLTHNPFEGGSMLQLDVNLLHNYDLATKGRLKPYVGVGGALNRVKAGEFSESSLGVNLISGARLAMQPDSRFEPFLNAQYTIIRDQGNPFTLVVGATFQLK